MLPKLLGFPHYNEEEEEGMMSRNASECCALNDLFLNSQLVDRGHGCYYKLRLFGTVVSLVWFSSHKTSPQPPRYYGSIINWLFCGHLLEQEKGDYVLLHEMLLCS